MAFDRPVGLMNIQGIVSGLDVDKILQQIEDIRRRPIEVLEQRKQQLQDRLSLIQTLEARVLAVQTAATSLADASTFSARSCTVSDESALAAAVESGAPIGTYSITINQLAQAHKISSDAFTAANEALGLSGDIIINGQAIHIDADDDLLTIAQAINSANAGVQATILHVADDQHKLIITASQTGSENAIDLVDASAGSVLAALGLVNSTETIKHAITNGAASDQISSCLDPVAQARGLQEPPSGTVLINGTAVTIDLSTDSLQDIADRINSTVSGVTATVETIDTGSGVAYQLRIVGDSGTPTFTDDNNVLAALGILTKSVKNEITPAQDAVVVIDGNTITRSTNSIDDAIDGVSLQLKQADPSATIELRIDADLSAAVDAVRDFVDKYNDAIDFIRDNQKFDPETNTGGPFLGLWDVTYIAAELRRAVTNPVSGLQNAPYNLLWQVGITTDQEDHLVFDQSTFEQALRDNPQAVQQLFTTTATTTSAYVTFVSCTEDTQPSPDSGYPVSITQVATKARAESASLPSGITTTETLTFYDQYSVTLQAGWTLDEAANALNELFDSNGLGLVASVSGDRIVIEHELYGSDYDIVIKSSLDQGAGGTDLGGPTAGENATYQGQDVAGTIAGEPATGRGQYLTGDEGNTYTAGLKLRITATTTGDAGVVYLAKGAAQRLVDLVNLFEESETGTFSRVTDRLNDEIDKIDGDIDRLEQQLQSYLDDLQRKFIAMEQALGQAQALSQYITNQIAGIANLRGFGRR